MVVQQRKSHATSDDNGSATNAILDEQGTRGVVFSSPSLTRNVEQDELVEKLKYDNTQLDGAFKNIMALLSVPLMTIYAFHLFHTPRVPLVGIARSSNPYATAAPLVTFLAFATFGVVLVLNIRGRCSNRLVEAVLCVGSATALAILVLQYCYGNHDAEMVYWAVSVVVLGGFYYSWHEMEGAGQQMEELERLKYRMKGA